MIEFFPILSLPQTLLPLIFSFVVTNPADVSKLSQVCKIFKMATDSDLFMKSVNRTLFLDLSNPVSGKNRFKQIHQLWRSGDFYRQELTFSRNIQAISLFEDGQLLILSSDLQLTHFNCKFDPIDLRPYKQVQIHKSCIVLKDAKNDLFIRKIGSDQPILLAKKEQNYQLVFDIRHDFLILYNKQEMSILNLKGEVLHSITFANLPLFNRGSFFIPACSKPFLCYPYVIFFGINSDGDGNCIIILNLKDSSQCYADLPGTTLRSFNEMERASPLEKSLQIYSELGGDKLFFLTRKGKGVATDLQGNKLQELDFSKDLPENAKLEGVFCYEGLLFVHWNNDATKQSYLQAWSTSNMSRLYEMQFNSTINQLTISKRVISLFDKSEQKLTTLTIGDCLPDNEILKYCDLKKIKTSHTLLT